MERGANLAACIIRKGTTECSSIAGRSPHASHSHAATVASPPTTTMRRLNANLESEATVQLPAADGKRETNRQQQTNTPPSRPPKRSVKRHSIFPGAGREKNAQERPRSWDESQWIV